MNFTNAMKNRKVLVLLGPVLGLLMFGAVVKLVSVVLSREYKQPYGAPAATVDSTPRAEGAAADQADAEKQAQATPYVEAEYRRFPLLGSRGGVWVVAALHP